MTKNYFFTQRRLAESLHQYSQEQREADFVVRVRVYRRTNNLEVVVDTTVMFKQSFYLIALWTHSHDVRIDIEV